MKFPWLLLSVSLGATALFAADAKKADKPALKKPDVRLDLTPVGDGKGPALTSYADVLDNIRPAVVSVYSSKTVRQEVPPLLRRLYGPGVEGPEERLDGLGSGVIVSSDGYILTNNHVVADADELKVKLNDERELVARLVGTDPKTDIAVIKIDTDSLPAATLADSDKMRIGDIVFAIGNPLGVGQTVTMGIISATGRHVGILDDAGYEDFIQTDAAINLGNSGGALIDAKGRLIGINSAIISNNQGSIGIGFAIPVNLARSIMNSLIETGTVARGYLGVATDPLTPDLAESFGLPKETKGVVISDVPANGPALKAGLKREDIITAVNAKPVTSRDDLRLMIAETPPGSKITVKFLRDGKPQSLDVMVDRLQDDSIEGELLTGMKVAPLNDDSRRDNKVDDSVDGLIVTDMSSRSPFADIFPVGAVIVQINRTPVTDLASAKRALHDGRNMALINYRGANRFVVFRVH
ncbi:MAG TPA: Do family serine endopeptidase [Candidatus Didemnitutus sp.]|jgi:serine protease Do/serine protease DegQ